jgi:hypothetical protein
VWYAKEKTLSIHSIFTRQREIFYWLAILFTFALGTAAGDLMAERLGLGYGLTGLIIAGVIVMFALAWRMGLNAIIAFWFIYIMTRPLGASLGDYLTQSKAHGGLGLGATVTSIIFLAGIVVTVIYLALTKRDMVTNTTIPEKTNTKSGNAIAQLVAVLIILLTISVGGYYWRQHALLNAEPGTANNSSSSINSGATSGAASYPLGDVSVFKTITQDTLNLVNAGNMSGAKTRVADLEYEWDTAQSRLKPMNSAKWTEVDGSIDKVLREIRAVNPSQQNSKAALETLLSKLSN